MAFDPSPEVCLWLNPGKNTDIHFAKFNGLGGSSVHPTSKGPAGYIADGVESAATRDNTESYGVSMDDVIVIKSIYKILELFEDHIHAVSFRHDVHWSLRDTNDVVMAVIELN